jgi:hypothetical protein
MRPAARDVPARPAEARQHEENDDGHQSDGGHYPDDDQDAPEVAGIVPARPRALRREEAKLVQLCPHAAAGTRARGGRTRSPPRRVETDSERGGCRRPSRLDAYDWAYLIARDPRKVGSYLVALSLARSVPCTADEVIANVRIACAIASVISSSAVMPGSLALTLAYVSQAA